MTLGKFCNGIYLSLNPAILVGMFYWVAGWAGALACVALLAFVWFVIWGCEQP